MENFDLLLDKMNENYSYLQTIMGVVYEKVKENPEDESSMELLESLGNLGKRMLSTEESLIVSYGSPDETINLMDRISDKKQVLTTSLEETTMGKRL